MTLYDGILGPGWWDMLVFAFYESEHAAIEPSSSVPLGRVQSQLFRGDSNCVISIVKLKDG